MTPPDELARTRLRTAAMLEFIEGYLTFMEATDQERMAIGTGICFLTCDKRNVSIEEAVKSYETSLREFEARYNRHLN